MNAYRHVKLFKNGRNQAVRIPREFELPGQDAIMRRDGDKLIIEPAPPRFSTTIGLPSAEPPKSATAMRIASTAFGPNF